MTLLKIIAVSQLKKNRFLKLKFCFIEYYIIKISLKHVDMLQMKYLSKKCQDFAIIQLFNK